MARSHPGKVSEISNNFFFRISCRSVNAVSNSQCESLNRLEQKFLGLIYIVLINC